MLTRLHPAAPLTGLPIVGRDSELATAIGLLRDPGLPKRTLWVTGVAGVGRSRLLAELTAQVDTDFPDGVVWLGLGAFPPGADVVDGVARALDNSGPDRDPAADVAAALGELRVLVVLDDVDAHDIGPVREAVAKSPGAALVATAVRPPPGIEDTVMVLGPLAVPDEGRCSDPEQVVENPAVRMFAQCAGEADPDFALEPVLPFVTDICRSLGGHPLALRLAAAQTRILGSGAVAERMRTRPPQGAREALTWTYEQLAPETRSALRRLGCFAGPFDLTAATAVSGKTEDDLIEQVSVLVDLHLLAQVGTVEDVSYTMSHLVRDLARTELDRSGEVFEVGRLHAEHHAELARAAADQIDDARETRPCSRLDADLELAERWHEEQGDHAEALRLALDRAPVSNQIGDPVSLVSRLKQLLRRSGHVERGLRSDCLLRLAQLRFESIESQDTLTVAVRDWREGMALARATAEPLRLIRGLRIATVALPVLGDPAGALQAAEEGLAVAERIGHVRWMARFEALIGMIHHQVQDFPAAAASGERALERALRAGDRRALISVGVLIHPMPPDVRPDLPLLPALPDLVEIAEEIGEPEIQGILLIILAGQAAAAGNVGEAAYWIARRLDLPGSSNYWRGTGYTLLMLAQLAGMSGDLTHAARLHGTIATRLEMLRAGMPPEAAAAYDRVVDGIRTRLGDEAFEEHASTGSRLPWPQAVIEASSYAASRSCPPGPSLGRSRSADRSGLTPREIQVLRLLALGLSNREIGERLGVTPKTVMHHSGAIYRKLGVRRRAQAASHAAREGLLED